ncbi:MAG: LamG domain-containing protein [Pseudomonadota bacterium]
MRRIFLACLLVLSAVAWGGAVQAAITWVGATSAATAVGGSNSITLTYPAGIAADDLLIAQVTVRGNRTITPPAGWTLISRVNRGTTLTQAIFRKFAAASNPPSEVWSINGSVRGVGAMAAYRGVDPFNPIDVFSARTNGSSTSITADSVTPTVSGVWLVGLFAHALGGVSIAPPATMTERVERVLTPSPASNGIALELADEAYAGGTAPTGTRVATASAAAANIGHLVALRPSTASAATLLAEYRFDECFYTDGVNQIIDTTGNYHATPRNGLTTGAPGKIQRMADYDTYARWASTAIPIGNTWSLSAWLYLPIATTHRYHVLASKTGGGDLLYLDRNNNFRWGVYDGTTATNGSFQFGSLSAGWHHILLRAGGSSTQLFVDGVYRDQVNRKVGGTLNYLGTSYDNLDTTSAQGIGTPLDEVRIYSGLLSGGELATLYANQNAGRNADGTLRPPVVCPSVGTPLQFNACEVSNPRCVPTATAGDPIGTYANLHTKRRGVAGYQLDLVRLRSDGTLATSFDGNVTVRLYAYANPADTLDSVNCPTATPTAIINLGTANFNNGRATIALPTFTTAYRDVRVRFECAVPTCAPAVNVCSSDRFAVRPDALSVTTNRNADPTGTSTTATAYAAGTVFTLTAAGGTGYNGVPAIDAGKVEAHAGAVQAGIVAATFAAGDASGNAISTSTTYSEVGYFRLLAQGVYDASFTLVDRAGPLIGCADNFDNPAPGAGLPGCKFGNTANTPYFGRFRPDHFKLSGGAYTPACEAPGKTAFTYLGQDFDIDFTLTANNAFGNRTYNYTAGYAKLAPSAPASFNFAPLNLAPDDLPARLSLPAALTGDWADGQADFGGAFRVRRLDGTVSKAGGAQPVQPDGPYPNFKLTARPVDGDGVTLLTADLDADTDATPGNDRQQIAGGLLRFGRLRLANATGSERLALPIRATVQYWDGTGMVTHVDDDCSAIPALAAVAQTSPLSPGLTFYPQSGANQLAAGETVPLTNPPLISGGVFPLVLSAPGPGNHGYLDLVLDAPDWLRYNWDGIDQGADANWLDDNPRARAAFGKRRGSERVILRQELY